MTLVTRSSGKVAFGGGVLEDDEAEVEDEIEGVDKLVIDLDAMKEAGWRVV